MLKGSFVDNTPYIPILVAWGQSVQAPFFVLDTGFTGDLQVTPKISEELGLQVVGVTPARIADGTVVHVKTALALVSMEGAVDYVEILISDSFPLAGIGLLSKFGYKAILDCKHKTIALEQVM